MTSHKTCGHWCNNIYTSGAGYSKHTEKKYKEHCQQTFCPLLCLKPNATGILPEPKEQNAPSESTRTPIQDLEPEYSESSEADIDPAELAGIQELYY